ncbi:MAG: SPFH domain-containing protein [Terriglobales bacterium]
MDTSSIPFAIFLAAFAALWYRRVRVSKTKRFFITDFQCGIRYRAGAFANEMGPGSYDVYTPKEQVIVLDLRPQPFVIERLFYRDALQSPSVISIGAELKVAVPSTACIALKDQVNESVAIVRDTLRDTISKTIADATPEARKRASRDIETAANTALSKVGMQISKLEITELWSAISRSRKISGAN